MDHQVRVPQNESILLLTMSVVNIISSTLLPTILYLFIRKDETGKNEEAKVDTLTWIVLFIVLFLISFWNFISNFFIKNFTDTNELDTDTDDGGYPMNAMALIVVLFFLNWIFLFLFHVFFPLVDDDPYFPYYLIIIMTSVLFTYLCMQSRFQWKGKTTLILYSVVCFVIFWGLLCFQYNNKKLTIGLPCSLVILLSPMLALLLCKMFAKTDEGDDESQKKLNEFYLVSFVFLSVAAFVFVNCGSKPMLLPSVEGHWGHWSTTPMAMALPSVNPITTPIQQPLE